MTKGEIKIVIADDHPIVRQGLVAIIGKAPDLLVVGEASDGPAALGLIQRLRPDIALIDIGMPGLDGFAVARKIIEQQIPVALIFLTAHREEALFEEAMEIGAKGYVLKESVTSEIVNGIRAVAAGQHYVSPALTGYLVRRGQRRNTDASATGLNDLTSTEQRILKLIAQYKTSKEIADELNISYHTVVTHRRNISEKLNISGSHALMKFALAHLSELP
ncbi:MAG TPA: response regulator transcription factor [Blastocatellia bacterium]|nr:response regulator transcription factor [Blastocatellia bacterium]